MIEKFRGCNDHLIEFWVVFAVFPPFILASGVNEVEIESMMMIIQII